MVAKLSCDFRIKVATEIAGPRVELGSMAYEATEIPVFQPAFVKYCLWSKSFGPTQDKEESLDNY